MKLKLGICTGFEHVETKTEEVVFREEVDFLSSLAFVVHPASPSGAIFILAGGHVRASAGALAVHTALILAGGHVRASAGALAVHTALILTRVTRD